MRLEGIDLLRGLAVLLVVNYHFFELLGLQSYSLFPIVSHLGQLGVPLFFIISGYLIYRSIEHNILHKGTKEGVKNYFLHRLFRIIPAYYVNLFIVFLLAVYVLNTVSPWSLPFILKQILAHLTFTSYFLYQTSGFGINGAYWTLSIEMLWYFIAPLLFLYIKKDRYYLIIILFAMLYLLSIDIKLIDSLFHLDLHASNYLAKLYFFSFQLPAQIIYFIAGIFIYKYIHRPSILPSMMSYLLFLMLLMLFYYLSTQTYFLESFLIKNVITVIITSLFFILFYNHHSKVLIPLAWIGKISYSMYLWHMPILSLMQHYNTLTLFSFWINVIFFIIILLIISSISYYFVEEGGFKLRKRVESFMR